MEARLYTRRRTWWAVTLTPTIPDRISTAGITEDTIATIITITIVADTITTTVTTTGRAIRTSAFRIGFGDAFDEA